MKNAIEKSDIDRLWSIKEEIYQESEAYAKRTLPKVIEAGKIYTKFKAKLDHGEWIPWIEKNSPFSRFTVARFMRVYENREKFKCVTVTHLKDALLLLSDGKNKDSKNETVSYLKKAKALPKAQEESRESSPEEQGESAESGEQSDTLTKEEVRIAIHELSALWWTQNSKAGYHDFTRIALTKYLVSSI